MIVKNETGALRTCLESVKPIIDRWAIVDTGSTDGTQDLVKECLQEIPGELYERPWVDFAQSRNEALDMARGRSDYIFFIDADETLWVGPRFEKQALERSFYYVKAKGAAADHYRILLIDGDPRWRWEGVLHEYLIPPPGAEGVVAEDLLLDCSGGAGGRAKDPAKHLKDAAVLEEALKKEPGSARYAFYLGQSYAHAGEFARAAEWYEKSASLGGDPDQRFWALYCVAHLHHLLGSPAKAVIGRYCRAAEEAPSRAEPFERLATFFLEQGWPLLGRLAAAVALRQPPASPLFANCHPWVCEYGALWIYAQCAEAAGDGEAARESYKKLLENDRLPDDIKTTIQTRIL